jgi:hypothetical protein
VGGRYVEYTFGRDSVFKVGFYREPFAKAGRAVLIKSTLPLRTTAGVGVGSTYDALRTRLGARCYRQLVGQRIYAPYRDFVVCYLGQPEQTPITSFSLIRECSLPPERYVRICPTNKRVFPAVSVTIVSKLGQSVLGGSCRFERAHLERCR